MSGLRSAPIRLLSSVICFSLSYAAIAQSADQQAGQAIPPPPMFTLQTTTRVVNLEVVVKDARGNHIKGLVPMDFQIYEQTPSRSKEKRLQTIGAFHEVSMADLARGAGPLQPLPAGVFTNAVSPQKEPVPPTVLLVDGLNTDVQSQAQVHVQMLRMLAKLPANVPVAVFLLGDRLRMLQGFTTDPRLMQAALRKATSTAGVGLAEIDPRDDPNTNGSFLAAAQGAGDPSLGVNSPPSALAPNSNPTTGLSGFLADPGFAAMVTIAQEFDQRIFSANNDEKVFRTIVAMTSLGHNLAGYPGRKNLLWLSTTFPISLAPFGLDSPGSADEYAGYRNYGTQLRHLNAVLSDAKISVYPIDIAGVQTMSAYQAGARPADITPTGMAANARRENQMRSAEVDTMQEVANGTGGRICTGDNNLGDCVQKAVDDSSDFYEISYSPDSPNWNGEFRKVFVKTDKRNMRLSYRLGYYANPLGTPDSKAQEKDLKADCDDTLNATSITFRATNLPSDAPDQLKFSLLIDSAPVTFSPTADGLQQLNLAIGVCTYNEKGWALNLMNYPVNLKLNSQQFQIARTTGRLTDSIRVPGPKPAAVRLLVKDVPSENSARSTSKSAIWIPRLQCAHPAWVRDRRRSRLKLSPFSFVKCNRSNPPARICVLCSKTNPNLRGASIV